MCFPAAFHFISLGKYAVYFPSNLCNFSLSHLANFLCAFLFHVIFETIAARGRQRCANDLINDNHIFHYAQTDTQ